ncbi:MAG: cysteine synthase family protein [Halieaceae bacterium]|jgi:cysteine synthase A|nr:cysteine synthase family protein [Halieaceae bacterium]
MSKSENTVLDNLSEAIGSTPMVRLDRLTANLPGTIVAKLEYLNPGFSKKDRPALQIILDAEESGKLSPGQTVVELTSGNMGTGLAIVCCARGYPFVAVMSRGNSPERARMMRALGAEVILVDQAPGSVAGQVSGADLHLVEARTQSVVAERGAFRADQFTLSGNMRSHLLGTGSEMLRQTGGNLDAFVDFAGSGGTLAGVATALKQHNPEIRCYAVEPDGARAPAGGNRDRPEHPIQGGGYNMEALPALQDVELDGYLEVSADDAVASARMLARTEGIFAGFSAGANVAAALQLLQGDLAGKTIAVIICDSGLKYLSTDLWQ